MKSLSQIVRNVSNKVKSNLAKGIFGLGIVGMSLYNTGCATMTEAQKISMAGNALMLSSQYSNNSKDARNAAAAGSLLTTYGQMQQQLDVAKAGKPETSVTIINNIPESRQESKTMDYNNQNNNPPVDQNQNNLTKSEDNCTPIGFFIYKKHIDFNENDMAERDEFVGLNEVSYNLKNLPYLQFSFYGGGSKIYNGKMHLNIWSMDDVKLINYFDEAYNPLEIQRFPCESKYFPKSGKYKAVLNTENKETFTLDFEVIK